MSDLGQDTGSLRVKVLELEYAIEQSKLARKSIELDQARIAQRLTNYEKSISEIDAQIKENNNNLQSMRAALQKAEDTDHG